MPACTASSAPAQHGDCPDRQRHSCAAVPRGTPACRRLRRIPSSPWSGRRPRTDSTYDRFISIFSCSIKPFRPLFVPWRVDPGTAESPPSMDPRGDGGRGRSGREGMPDRRLTHAGDPADNILACVCITHASTASREKTHTHVCRVCTRAQLQGRKHTRTCAE